MKIRRSDDRGLTTLSWLHSRHTFSFGDYVDPNFLGYRSLRVINDDRVAPGKGFGTHGHRDMEIVTIVVEGELEHQDSLGHRGVLRPGEVQVMSAGTGIRHSEVNPSPTQSAHFLQIWIEPSEKGLAPRYQQKPFAADSYRNAWRRVAGSSHVKDDALTLHQDADIYRATLEGGRTIVTEVPNYFGSWIHVVHGQVAVEGTLLASGDAAQFDGPQTVTIEGVASKSELVGFFVR